MYGFVYLWFDRYKRMFYLGSHVGSENDGYICSSKKMLNAYKKRPQDFRRRIIERIFDDNIKKLRTAELNWLLLIKPEELESRYYNIVISSDGFNGEGAKQAGKIGGKTKMARMTAEERIEFGKLGWRALVNKVPPEVIQKGRLKGILKIHATTPKAFWIKNGTTAGNASWTKRSSDREIERLRSISLLGGQANTAKPVEDRREAAAKGQVIRKAKYGPSGLSPKYQKKVKPKLTPEERSINARYASSFLSAEQLTELARVGRTYISKQQLRKNGIQVAACRTIEQRKADAAKFFAGLTKEERIKWALRMNGSRTTEQRSEARRQAHARLTPEERIAVAMKSAATRRANTAAKNPGLT